MKFEKIAEVGNVIRAYDFKPMNGRPDCFVEGIVEAVRDTSQYFNAYRIKVTKDQFGDEPGNRVGKIVFVPHEVSFMEYDARIINLSK